ncbi:MAG TPA: hypothetical protein VJV05_17415 [Pyrinomonadaceae bacterium]|nr:hypothetical protein [Pyrinomonadaceae bacterium]
MKRFFVSVLFVTVFCIGLGALVERTTAKFKSDEKALAIIKQARAAIGGDPSIADVRSMIIKGNTSVTLKFDGTTRTEQGETEIALQLPDKLSKMVKIGRAEGAEAGERMISKQHDVMIMRNGGEGHGEAIAGGQGQKVIIKKVDGDDPEVEKIIATEKGGDWKSSDGKTITIRRASDGPVPEEIRVRHGGPGEPGMHGEGHRQNELLRTTLSLLLTAPEGMDVSYTFVGEGDVDGTTCNIVNAEFAGSNFKLYLSKASSLPVMLSYQGHAMPRVIMLETKSAEGAPVADKVVTFTRKVDAPEMSEIQVKFSDYRGTNGVQLPYKWTTTTAGQPNEIFEVTSYEVNPANIADKFQNQKVFVRTKKDGQ